MIKKANNTRRRASKRRRKSKTPQQNYPKLSRLLQKKITFLLISLCRKKKLWKKVTQLVILLVEFITKKGLLIPYLLKSHNKFNVKSTSDPFHQ